MEPFPVIRFEPPTLHVLDQVGLPHEERWLALTRLDELEEAIRALRVRGAPLLGLCGAAGVAMAAGHDPGDDALRAAAERIAAVRPTAVELATGAGACLAAALAVPPGERAKTAWAFCREYFRRRQEEDRELAEVGAEMLPAGDVLTHCNTGTLATGGIGTALGVVRAAHARGKLGTCYVTETRPLLQGARLTAWELQRSGIPAMLLPDTAAASLVVSGRVASVVTGADRIAMNGDTANKVGTLGLALAAARGGVPFYIAAPTSTIDPKCKTGAGIPIEFRPETEVGGYGSVRWAPDGVPAWNPAFDVTPAELISGIVTERGVARAPYRESLARLFRATTGEPSDG
ncbi:MAG: methylthioribose-1-phosphate isomerase [Tepidiforma sp.]|nr:MAG: methylthioribose-1-phosphate isomerase [Tepidiforma sp.]